MNEKALTETWSENVILADADYIDRVAFDLTVNFERMLERPIPKADLARWVDCVTLDATINAQCTMHNAQSTLNAQRSTLNAQCTMHNQVILLHSKERRQLDNFTPGNYAEELDGKAFSDQLGEFCFSCVAVEPLTTMENLFAESLQHICRQKEVKRLMVIGDHQYYDRIKAVLTQAPPSVTTTVFTMQPMPGGRFRQEILGYSLMAALGIQSAEIEKSTNKL